MKNNSLFRQRHRAQLPGPLLNLRLILLLSCWLLATPLWAQSTLPTAGIGLGGIVDYSGNFPFVDVMKQSGDWRNGLSEQSEQLGSQYIDANGWVKSLPSGSPGVTCRVVFDNLKVNSPDGHLTKGVATITPGGDYVLTWEGDANADVRLVMRAQSNEAPTKTRGTRRKVYTLANGAEFVLQVRSIPDAANYPRNIKIWMPGTEGQDATFSTAFKNNLAKFGVLRFMDWGQTNDSPQINWSDRTPKTYRTQTLNGFETSAGLRKGAVAYEYMIDLANGLDKDMWINIPHQASDDYVKQLATLVKNNLESGRRCWVEYSNEVWNSQFKQYNWVTNNVSATDLPNDYHSSKYGKRSKQVFALFDGVFGAGSTRVVTVLAGQSANGWELEQAANVAGNETDVFAITHYFNNGVVDHIVNNSLHKNSDKAAGLTNAFNFLDNSLNTYYDGDDFKKNKAVADKYGKPLISYEGGQHIVASAAQNGDEDLNKFIFDLQRDARMGAATKKNLQKWTAAGFKCPVSFVDASGGGKWGMWGHKEYAAQPDAQAPKFAKLLEWIAEQEGTTGGGGGGGGTPTTSSTVQNPSFEADGKYTKTPTGWQVWSGRGNELASFAENKGGGHTGSYHGTHWQSSAYQVYTYQKLSGLTNGTYTLKAWVKSTGGQAQVQMEAKDFGSGTTILKTPIAAGRDEYVPVKVENIVVSNGQCTIGFYSDASAGNWLYFDDVEFTRNATTTGNSIANGTYTLTPKCAPANRVDVTNAVTTNGTRIQSSVANTNNAQKWEVQLLSDGYYRLSSKLNTGKVLDVHGGASANGTKVELYDWLNNDGQKWRFVSMGDGYFRLEPKCAPGKALDVTDGSSSSGAKMQLWETYNNNDIAAQQYKFTAITTASATVATSSLTTVADASATPAQALSVYPNPLSSAERPTVSLRASQAQPVTVYVYDTQRQLVSLLTRRVEVGDNQVALPSTLPAGRYYVKATLKGEVLSFTLQVK